jgi:hypothetical protein
VRYFRLALLLVCLLIPAVAVYADNDPLDCGKKSLNDAIQSAGEKDPVITFTGVCSGPVVVRTDGITLRGVGLAVIDGGRQDAVTIEGASRVSLADLEVRNGRNGILGSNGAHFSLSAVNSHDNLVFGISLQTGSSAILLNVVTNANGLHGLDLQTGSAATVTGTHTASNNRVFGINVNASSITFADATVSATGNALGIQVATNGNAFINDPRTAVNVNNNLSTGLTVVSGGQMFSFGGTINASGNGLNGVSVNSKAGLDLDAASTLNSFNNMNGVVMQEASVMTVFNIPQFSGVSGFSTVNVHNNRNGLVIQSGSTLTLTNQAGINSNQNTQTGFVADNASVTLVNSTIKDNTLRDIQLTFGTRADLQTLMFNSYTCDATVLVRGSSGISCPH